MDGGNFLIKSNWLLSHSIPAGLPSTVVMQINQDAKTSFANDVNVFGNLNTDQNLDNNGTATFRRDIEIRPTTLNTQAGILMRGGSSSVDNFWYVGRGAWNIGQNNFVIGSNMIAPISNGITQDYVGFQINTDRKAYFTGKVHALDGLEVRGDLLAYNNAPIQTLQVNDWSYLKKYNRRR